MGNKILKFSKLLEEEDMSYLKNKYLPKLEDEYQSEINKINKMYNK